MHAGKTARNRLQVSEIFHTLCNTGRFFSLHLNRRPSATYPGRWVGATLYLRPTNAVPSPLLVRISAQNPNQQWRWSWVGTAQTRGRRPGYAHRGGGDGCIGIAMRRARASPQRPTV